jgi:integrase/recombinase XerD
VVQGSAEAAAYEPLDPERFQADCVQAYVASWVARGYSQVTIDTSTARLERVLATLGKPAWEATAGDIDEMVGTWASVGIVASTRRTYVQAFKGFYEFLTARKAVDIEFTTFPSPPCLAAAAMRGRATASLLSPFLKCCRGTALSLA